MITALSTRPAGRIHVDVTARVLHHLHPTGRATRSRWIVLAVLCASVFVVVLDGTIVNVALPTLATELGASTSELQWIVDSYVLVFAGLLMAAGSIGDRFGRKGVMQIGLVLFAVFSGSPRSPTAPGSSSPGARRWASARR